VLAAANTLSPVELAAKPGSYVWAAKSAGRAEKLVAAATTLSPAELLAKSHNYLLAMARASELVRWCGWRPGRYLQRP
jgi:hypothetical protein